MAKKFILNEEQVKQLIEITTQEIAAEAENVNTNPTEGQKEAGNYRMGHVRIKGMQISIENPKGSYRRGVDKDGKEWKTLMKNHYGYFTKSEGKDGDAVDVFIGPHVEKFDRVYVVDQKNERGEFDESKVMLGFISKEEAKDAYMSNYSSDWKGFMKLTSVPIKVFKVWLYRGRKQRQPFYQYAYIQKKKLKENNARKTKMLFESYEEENEYDILYRGLNQNQNNSAPVSWYTTSKEYAKQYGGVKGYKIPVSTLNNLADENIASKYLVEEVDGYPFYEAENFDIDAMKEDGYTGYYYRDDEYNCLNVCIFKK